MSEKTRYSSVDFFRDAKPMLLGVTQIASAVKEAYGPRGEPIKICRETGKPRYIKRGYLIIDALTPSDQMEARGAHMLALAARSATAQAGDGSTTATIIGEAILNQGESLIAEGTDPFALEKGIERAIDAALGHLEQQARRRLTAQQVAGVAMIAADNDREIGEALSRLIVAGEDLRKFGIKGADEPGVAIDDAHVLHIGPGGGVDLEERLLRASAALYSLHLALEGGVVAGGGAALLHATDALADLSADSTGEKAGIDIVRRALQAPARQLALTAGSDPEDVTRAVMKTQDFAVGYDVLSNTLRNMFDAGIIDPVKVVGGALEQAGKIARAYVTVPGILGAGAQTVRDFRRKNRGFARVFPEMFGPVVTKGGPEPPDMRAHFAVPDDVVGTRLSTGDMLRAMRKLRAVRKSGGELGRFLYKLAEESRDDDEK